MGSASSAGSPAPAVNLSGIADVEVLRSWMDAHRLESGPLEGFRRIGGGTQNVMLRFERGGRSFVLRRGPRHLRTTTNAALNREMRILKALQGSGVPLPRFIAGSDEEPLMDGSAFYLMEPIEGFNAATELPSLHRGSAAIRHHMGLAMIDAVAALSGVDYRAIGLADLGRPDGFLQRQVTRWLTELEGYKRHEGYPGAPLPEIDSVARWLTANTPESGEPGVMHGDFHVANVMFEVDGPEVAAVVDWEMCTIGDPLVDVGWMLATWPYADQPAGIGDSALARAGNLASPRELVERYADNSGRDVSAIGWYTTLACFKLGILLEGTYARACAGAAEPGVGEYLHGLAEQLLTRASMLVDGAQLI
ncbi:aminoglycoside phosphotransferase [Mycolicibacterium rhodesiae JS60]|nr:aminoglycoside phosphotransferase [Mycolicibacterium rhodesiae JS60]